MMILWGVMTSHIRSMSIETCCELTNIAIGHCCNKNEEIKKKRFTYKYIILDIFYDCEHSLKYYMLRS